MGGDNVENRKADSLTVTFDIDLEQLPALQGALAFMADICSSYGIGRDGETRKDSAESRHYGEALGYILYIAAEIGAAVLDAHI